jgi:hypothetical protein
MANIPTGKTKYSLRLKPSEIEGFKEIAMRSGYPTHATLCADILSGCLVYLTDINRTRMPDVLLNLKQKLSVDQLNEVVSHVKEEPNRSQKIEELIGGIIERKMSEYGLEKKIHNRATASKYT